MSYLPCELHCHTVHSDGGFQVKELLESAKNNGLSLIALTDHNTISGYEELDDTVIPVIRGIEWTTYFGHMLVLGAEGFVDWRDAVPDNIDKKIKEVKARNGIVGIAHPFQMGSPICTGGRWEFNVNDWSNVDYIEIWHEDFNKPNRENEKSTALWTALLDRGYKIAASYGRDWHRPAFSGLYGCTYLDIDGEVTAASALKAIRQGKTVVSAGAAFYFELINNNNVFSIGDTVYEDSYTAVFHIDINARKSFTDEIIEYKTIRIVSNGGTVIAEADLNVNQLTLRTKQNSWYRAELWGNYNGKYQPLAITSPIYCD